MNHHSSAKTCPFIRGLLVRKLRPRYWLIFSELHDIALVSAGLLAPEDALRICLTDGASSFKAYRDTKGHLTLAEQTITHNFAQGSFVTAPRGPGDNCGSNPAAAPDSRRSSSSACSMGSRARTRESSTNLSMPSRGNAVCAAIKAVPRLLDASARHPWRPFTNCLSSPGSGSDPRGCGRFPGGVAL
jgi:hypothetical protein